MPAFMSPEQLSGGSVDRRTDVYALGCLAYDLLMGRHLFWATKPLGAGPAKVDAAAAAGPGDRRRRQRGAA